MAQVDTDGKHGLFLHEQLAHLHTEHTQDETSNIASDVDIMENNNMFVMLWNLSVINHWIFPHFFFFFNIISGAKSKNSSLLREDHKKCNFMIIITDDLRESMKM